MWDGRPHESVLYDVFVFPTTVIHGFYTFPTTRRPKWFSPDDGRVLNGSRWFGGVEGRRGGRERWGRPARGDKEEG